jgi:hypothetical protein
MMFFSLGLAVGEIPTLKTQAKLNRNIMLYELFFDYEIFHLQLKRVPRTLLSRIRKYMCHACCRRNIRSGLHKPSSWLCEVDARDAIDDDQLPEHQCWPVKFYNWLVTAIQEDDIQSSITTEKQYQKQIWVPKKEEDEEEGGDD